MRAPLFVLVLGLTGRVVGQQPGELDLSFDIDGKLVLPGYGPALDVRSLPEGGIRIVTSFIEGGLNLPCVVGLLNDGSIDPSYGVNGVYRINDPVSTSHSILYVDDELYFAYWTNDSILFSTKHDQSGFGDTDYGSNGIASIQPGISFELRRIIATPDGHIIPSGSRRRLVFVDHPFQPFYLEAQDAFVARIGPEGLLDLAFNGSGYHTWNGTPSHTYETWDVTLLPDGATGSLVNVQYGTFPGSNVFARKLDSHGVDVGLIPVFNGSGGTFPGSIFGSSTGSVMTTADSYWTEPYVGPQQRTAVPSGSNAGSTTYVEWMADNSEGQAAGRVSTASADANGDLIVAGHMFGPLSSFWYCGKIPSVGSGFMQPFGVEGFASVEIAPASQAMLMSSCSQPDGKFILGGQVLLNGIGTCALARLHNIPDPRSTLSLRLFLGGAYDSTTFLMRDDLRQQGLVPTLQPYAAPFFSAANGVGTWATPQHVLQVEDDSAVVDWVWLELISATDSATIAATRVGLLHRNGWVTSADGHSPIDFSAGAGSYFVRARHRNHLGVTASQAVALGPSVTTLDLTDPATATFGTDAQMEVNGVRMLWPGDANSDGAVKYIGPYNDRDRILTAIGGNTPTATLAGYHTEDINLDGVTKYVGTANDRDIILQVIGGEPATAVRVEQRP